MRKKCMAAVCMVVSLALAGCSTSSVEKKVTDAANEINDQVADVTDRQDEHVLFVKNGHPVSYPNISYGKALDEFFDDAKWKYFKGESGEDVVEFTGYCLYQDTKVKARLQFILDMDEGTFTQGALSFNDVPQNNLITGTALWLNTPDQLLSPFRYLNMVKYIHLLLNLPLIHIHHLYPLQALALDTALPP